MEAQPQQPEAAAARTRLAILLTLCCCTCRRRRVCRRRRREGGAVEDGEPVCVLCDGVRQLLHVLGHFLVLFPDQPLDCREGAHKDIGASRRM